MRAIAALNELGVGGLPAIPALLEALKDKDKRVRFEAIAALGGLGPLASSALPGLVSLMARSSGRQFLMLAMAVWQIAPCKGVIKSLIMMLSAGRPSFCGPAAVALGTIGPAAKPAIPALAMLAKHSDERVRRAAATAIALIQRSRN
jgi:HEAT repeat protein